MIGHSIEQCERDPNMKTKEDIEAEFERVTQLKDFRKLFPDTQIATTIFLKKCIKVKKYYMQGKDNESGLSAQAYKEKIAKQNEEAFQRGAMQFEDFNYENFNKYIFIDPDRTEQPAEEQQEEEFPGGFVP